MNIWQQELDRRECLDDTLYFTQYFFRANHDREFVVGDHHVNICEVLNKVYRGEIKRLIINVAPRYGKTEIAVKNFISKGLAHNPRAKFIHLSYSDDLALDNSEEIKETVKSEAYQRLFPHVQVRKGSDSKKKWYTTEGGGVYSTSAAGQVTGFGAGNVDLTEEDTDDDLQAWIDECGDFGGAIVIDDPIKPDDAESEAIRLKINKRFDTTIRSRTNSRNTPIVIIMQRLHPDDLVGHLLKLEPEEWTVLSLPSIKADGTALWPFKHTLEELLKLRKVDPITFERQHQQNALPREGLLYSKGFRTYKSLPIGSHKMHAVCDTADTGDDCLCLITYLATPTAYYVTDVYYTPESMEVTEEQAAVVLTKNNVRKVKIESNNGGRGFARNVEKNTRLLGNRSTVFGWFHQTENKEVRIFTQANEVQNMIVFPEGWETMWPAFYTHVTTFMAKGRNRSDDPEDALTMIIEAEGKVEYGISTSEATI